MMMMMMMWRCLVLEWVWTTVMMMGLAKSLHALSPYFIWPRLQAEASWRIFCHRQMFCMWQKRKKNHHNNRNKLLMYLPKLQCNFPFSGAAPDSNERVCPHFVPTSLPLSTQLFSLPGEHGGEMMTMWMEMVAMMGWLGWYIWWCWCCWCWCWWWCWWWWCWYWWWGLCRWWTKAKTCSLLIPDKSSRWSMKVTIMQMRIGCWNSGSPFMLAAYRVFLTTSPFSRTTPKDWDQQWFCARGDCGTSPKDRGKSPRKSHKGSQSSQESLVLQGRKFKCRAMYNI